MVNAQLIADDTADGEPLSMIPRSSDGQLLFLLNNEAASFVTGVVIPVDGGFSAYSGV